MSFCQYLPREKTWCVVTNVVSEIIWYLQVLILNIKHVRTPTLLVSGLISSYNNQPHTHKYWRGQMFIQYDFHLFCTHHFTDFPFQWTRLIKGRDTFWTFNFWLILSFSDKEARNPASCLVEFELDRCNERDNNKCYFLHLFKNPDYFYC